MSPELIVWKFEQYGFSIFLKNEEIQIEKPPRKRIPKRLNSLLEESRSEVIRFLAGRHQRNVDQIVDEAVARFSLSPCPCCRRSSFWVSEFGAITCAHCHPPACQSLVKKVLS